MPVGIQERKVVGKLACIPVGIQERMVVGIQAYMPVGILACTLVGKREGIQVCILVGGMQVRMAVHIQALRDSNYCFQSIPTRKMPLSPT